MISTSVDKAVLVLVAVSGLMFGQSQGTAGDQEPTRAGVKRISFQSALPFLELDNFVPVSDGGVPYLLTANGSTLNQVAFDEGRFRFFGQNGNGYIAYSRIIEGVPRENLFISKRDDNKDAVLLRPADIVRVAWRPGANNNIALLVRSGNSLQAILSDVTGVPWHQLPGVAISSSLLRWTTDGRYLLYAETVEGPDKIILQKLHKYDIKSAMDIVIPFEGDAAYLGIADGRAVDEFFEEPPHTSEFVLSANRASSISVHLDRDAGLVMQLRIGMRELRLNGWRPVHVFASWIIVERPESGGREMAAIDRTSLEVTPVFGVAAQIKLPWQSGASRTVTQDGSGYGNSGSSTCVSDHTGSMAYAYDFGISNSDHVLAAASGSVVATVSSVTCNSYDTACSAYVPNCTNNNGGWGNGVILMHSDGTYTKYAHFTPNSVRVVNGQAVSQGTYLGDPGHTGNTTGQTNGCGDHLHFQLQDVGKGMWADPSIRVSFAEAANPLACHASVTSANTEVAGGSFAIGGGATSDITAKVISAYQHDGVTVLGNPTSNVGSFSDTFYSPSIGGYYQNFSGGSSGSSAIDYIPGSSAAYSIKWGFYQLFTTTASYQSKPVYDLVAAPTDFQNPSNTHSIVGSSYTWQPFLKGSMYYFDSSAQNSQLTGKSTYVWGTVADRYQREGGRTGNLGLPTSELTFWYNIPGWGVWYQWFENGLVFFFPDMGAGTTWTAAYLSDNTWLGWCTSSLSCF